MKQSYSELYKQENFDTAGNNKRTMKLRNKYRKKFLSILIILIGIITPFSWKCCLLAEADEIVVCIDAGHGGKNLGARWQGYMEKDVNLMIAKAIHEELSKYEGVKVVMTRQEDVDLSLEERAEIAEAANADFLLSIHLNASEMHKYYGAEVWVSAYDEYYAEGRAMGELVLEQLKQDIGIYSGRGVKTKIGTQGIGDYYTIIDEPRLRNIPAVIIEHCYMDQMRENAFWKSESMLRALGKADAAAIAKYYGLKSEQLGVDYSNEKIAAYSIPLEPVKQDETKPDKCEIRIDKTGNGVSLQVAAEDRESNIVYYRYSADGGLRWSKLKEWPGGNIAIVDIDLPWWSSGELCVRVYNQYDYYTDSNVLRID